MAPKKQLDKAKAKAQRDKKIAIGGAVVLLLVLVFEVPKTMKMLSGPKTPVAAATTTAATTTTPSAATPTSIAAPTLGGTLAPATTTTSSDLVSAVPVSADSGQLQTFERFATKDPFAVQATTPASGGAKGGSSGGTSKPASGSSGSGSAPKAPPVPPTPPPTSAVISLNGQLMSVSPGVDFPTSGSVFAQAGALFHVVSLTQTTAKVSIAGGSYASGAPALTLHVGQAVTLQNTADGSKYTLLLEPQGTQVPTSTSGATTTSTTTTPTTTTTPSLPVVPSGGGG